MANEIINLENLARFKNNYDIYVASLISNALASVYKVKGSKTVTELNQMTSSSLHNGDVYNVTTSGTLTAGSVSVVAGDNVVWVVTNSVGAWDKFAGLVDLSGYLPKSAGSSQALTGSLYFGRAGYIGSETIASEEQLGLTTLGSGFVLTSLHGGQAFLDVHLISDVTREFAFPDKTGTFALTSDLTAQGIATYLGYTPYNGSTNPNGYITGITSQMITNALGYTPYSSANPNGYISGITSSMVTTALGYTPLSPNNFATNNDIDALFA